MRSPTPDPTGTALVHAPFLSPYRRHRRATPPARPLLALLVAVLATGAPPARPAHAAANCPEYVGAEALDVAAGDFDEDGKSDLAVIATPGKIALVFGEAGDRPTRPGGIIATGGTMRYIAAGDVNGDGHVDLVATSAAGFLRVLLGSGTGSFTYGDPIAAGTVPDRLVLADFNGDGKDDAAVLSNQVQEATILLADGAGGLAATSTLSFAGAQHAIAAGDVDGDGHRDVVILSEFTNPAQTMVTRFLGLGDGSFGAPAVRNLSAGHTALAVGDLNGDGRSDIVAASTLGLSPAAAVLLGQADGSFGAEADYALPAISLGGHAALADLDGDGDLDLAVLGGPYFPDIFGCTGNILATMRGGGDGALSSTGPPITTAGASTGLALADVNGDGRIDAAVTGGACGDVAVHPGAGDGTFTTTTNPMRAFTDRHNVAIHVNNNKPTWCVFIEPVDGSFDLLTEAPTGGLTLTSVGTGGVSSIQAGTQKEIVVGDADGNQIPDMRICFPKDRLQQLFSNVSGKRTLTLGLSGPIHDSSCLAATTLTIDVFAGGKGNAAAAFVRPNPLNPAATLTFRTDARGSYRVRVFDVAGRLVRTLRVARDAAAGLHDVAIDGKDDAGRPLPSGVYLYRIDAGGETTQGRFVIAK